MATPKRSNAYVLACAATVGVVCAAALTAAHQLLAPRQQANAAERNIRQVLVALCVPGAESATPQTAADLFAAKVREERRGKLTIYTWLELGEARAVAVPFSGRGYSAPIEGFLGLEPDLATLRAVTVTYHAETPGLGGQVGSRQFLDGFRGKRIDGLRLVRRSAGIGDRHPDDVKAPVTDSGTVSGSSEVDAITGATLTSGRFQAILDATAPVIRELRSERAR